MSKRLILFLKAPQPGHVKTRLTPIFSADEAAQLYENFVLDLLEQLKPLAFERYFFFTPQSEENQILGTFQLPSPYCIAQEGKDLGQRMANAFEMLFKFETEPTLIIGTDSPGIPTQWISFAFQQLETNNIVLGPTFDGGYYLLGMDAFYPSLFEQISWSTTHVFPQTLKKVQQAKLSLSVLPPFYDVDEPKDLYFLKNYLEACESEEKSNTLAPRTLKLLKSEPFLQKLDQFTF